MFKRIIVPLDGSELAASALNEAEDLARLTGAPLQLVRVVDFTMLESTGGYGMALSYIPTQELLEVEHERAEEYLETVAADLRRFGFTVSTAVYRGRVARVLTQVSSPGDVIVMASHGHGGLTRWFLGSVAEDVIRHATCPVLLLRATQQAAGESVATASVQTETAGTL